ncbi:MAG TPA: hypothetical protein VED18_15730 [Candidatus Sulfotelmatobacter sp.]|nr:hypothetical protein [Candidatus Sulfotelmatobacter sp.]
MAKKAPNPWKLATIGILLVVATAAITALLVTKRSPSEPAPSTPISSARRAGAGGGESQHASTQPSGEATPTPSAPVSASSPPAAQPESTQPPQAANPPASSTPSQTASPPAAHPASSTPSQAVIDQCNRYAAAPPSQRDKILGVGKDAAIGGVATAAVGAAAGAIAAGGKGAGKGAAIGGIVGVAAGSLYGINENHKADAEYQAAYAKCMHARGHSS